MMRSLCPRRSRGSTTGLAAMRAVIGLAIALAWACKGGQRDNPPQNQPPPPAVPVDAGVIDGDLGACRAAAARAPSLPRTQRTVTVLQACQPCGDWGPLLAWDIPTDKGGPTRAVIEQGMVACNAFCSSNAKQRFFSALESARGQDVRTPWRLLGELCRAEVSAVPDARFMGAPYFALDRAARMLGDAVVELPLPAVSVSGYGMELPTAPMVAPEAGPTALTIDPGQFLLGSLPIAKLTATGVQILGDYPGTALAPAALAAALARPELAGQPVAVIAPRQLPAARLVEGVAAAGGHDLRLAVADLELRNWIIPGTIPISLTTRPGGAASVRLVLDATAVEAIKAAQATPREALLRAPVTIAIDANATVATLANLLGALGYLDVKSVVLVKAPRGRPPAKP